MSHCVANLIVGRRINSLIIDSQIVITRREVQSSDGGDCGTATGIVVDVNAG